MITRTKGEGKKLRLVVVQWIDAEIGGGTWKPASEAAKLEAPVVYTVGFLLHRDRHNVVLASSASPCGEDLDMGADVMNDIVIPAGMVKKIVGPEGDLK